MPTTRDTASEASQPASQPEQAGQPAASQRGQPDNWAPFRAQPRAASDLTWISICSPLLVSTESSWLVFMRVNSPAQGAGAPGTWVHSTHVLGGRLGAWDHRGGGDHPGR